jgi:hypothetical protein
MPIYDASRMETLQNADARQRIAPLLADHFDPISLQRPGFATEIGLQSGDDDLLRLGSVGQAELHHPLFFRALAEEIRARSEKVDGFLAGFPALPAEQQWLLGCRIWGRWLQLLDANRCSPKTVAAQLEIASEDLEKHRQTQTRLSQEQQTELVLAIVLALLGVGSQKLGQDVEHQLHRKTFMVFQSDTPNLTDLGTQVTELQTSVDTPHGPVIVRRSLQTQLADNASLDPELWTKNWLAYFPTHRNLTAQEFSLFLDHLEANDRYKWTLMAAAGNTKARRAVASVAVAAVHALGERGDQALLQRLLKLFPEFSERYDLEAAWKK